MRFLLERIGSLLCGASEEERHSHDLVQAALHQADTGDNGKDAAGAGGDDRGAHASNSTCLLRIACESSVVPRRSFLEVLFEVLPPVLGDLGARADDQRIVQNLEHQCVVRASSRSRRCCRRCADRLLSRLCLVPGTTRPWVPTATSPSP